MILKNKTVLKTCGTIIGGTILGTIIVMGSITPSILLPAIFWLIRFVCLFSVCCLLIDFLLKKEEPTTVFLWKTSVVLALIASFIFPGIADLVVLMLLLSAGANRIGLASCLAILAGTLLGSTLIYLAIHPGMFLPILFWSIRLAAGYGIASLLVNVLLKREPSYVKTLWKLNAIFSIIASAVYGGIVELMLGLLIFHAVIKKLERMYEHNNKTRI